ncbi:hypothetical protein [Petrocella sp. FN5]|uniref:hypothetical protein n=1 Tax=Petrocella sp. FN5 TaxID=3032002 RepID=UPI0023D9FCC9|nr:hypothetical protein [Petrocella sp. FN5]MDF1616994.1 hypothetical protein [Petrocella sp. FN5]
MELCITKRGFNELTNEELGNLNGGGVARMIYELAGAELIKSAADGVGYILKNSKPLAPNQNPYFVKNYSRSSNKYPRLN